MAKKQYGDSDNYERKLERVMERLGVESYTYNFDRFGCYVEFRYRGELYRFDHSTARAQARGIDLRYGSDAFAQVVLSLEDLARMVERGIYELQTWVAGMRYLPPPMEIPSFFKYLGFTAMPAGADEVKDRFRSLAKQMHPDAGGDPDDFRKLTEASEQALKYFLHLIRAERMVAVHEKQAH